MISRPPRQDSLENTSLNLKSNNGTYKRHTIAAFYKDDLNGSNCRDSGLYPDGKKTKPNQPSCYNTELLEQQTNKSSRKHKCYWETIESHYTNRLGALEKEIETAKQQNSKLSMAHEELVQEILKLHRKAMNLYEKNDALSRTIAEKENHISAFMYNQPASSVQRQDNYGPIVGITLVDQPLTAVTSPPTPPLPLAAVNTTIHDDITITENITQTETPVKKEPGIFRQISLRLSNRKKRQPQRQPQEEANHQSSSLNISEPITDAIIAPPPSSTNSILHPAVVISSSPCNNKLRQLADKDNNTSSCKKKKNVVFGNDLIQQARSESTDIPSVVINCIKQVEARGLDVEGIYRNSGTVTQIKELQDAFDDNKNPKLSKYQDINVIASVLKLYFRELSAPLISDDFILPHSVNDQERLDQTYALLHAMPIVTYCTIKFLVQHLKRVHDNQPKNRMSLRNLAIVFGPTLLRHNENQQTQEIINTVEFIIQQSRSLFADCS